MSNDMNDSSYVPTNNQQPPEETPLATADQFPHPPGHFLGRDDEDFHGIDPDPFDGEFGNMEGSVEHDHDGVDFDDVADQEEQDAILEALIEEDRIAKEAEEQERTRFARMEFLGLDPNIPAAVNDLAYRQEYPTAEEVQTEAPADPTGVLPHVTPDNGDTADTHPAPKPVKAAAKKQAK